MTMMKKLMEGTIWIPVPKEIDLEEWATQMMAMAKANFLRDGSLGQVFILLAPDPHGNLTEDFSAIVPIGSVAHMIKDRHEGKEAQFKIMQHLLVSLKARACLFFTESWSMSSENCSGDTEEERRETVLRMYRENGDKLEGMEGVTEHLSLHFEVPGSVVITAIPITRDKDGKPSLGESRRDFAGKGRFEQLFPSVGEVVH